MGAKLVGAALGFQKEHGGTASMELFICCPTGKPGFDIISCLGLHGHNLFCNKKLFDLTWRQIAMFDYIHEVYIPGGTPIYKGYTFQPPQSLSGCHFTAFLKKVPERV